MCQILGGVNWPNSFKVNLHHLRIWEQCGSSSSNHFTNNQDFKTALSTISEFVQMIVLKLMTNVFSICCEEKYLPAYYFSPYLGKLNMHFRAFHVGGLLAKS